MDKKNTLLYGLTIAILGFGLFVLFFLERRVVSDRRAAMDNAQDLLGKNRILKAPDDIRISFSTIESLARSIKKNPFIRDIVVSKILPDRKEHVIYPFFYNSQGKDERRDLSRLKREPLTDNGDLLGYVYIELNNRIITGVRAAIAFFAVLLLLTLVSYYIRVHTQERVISATTVELEEKRKELIRLERLALAGQLTANILHDIKKPVLNIKQEAQDLTHNLKEETLSLAARNIQEQVDLFFNILRDLGLERFVKAREQDEEYVDINEMLDRSCSLVRYERGSIEMKKEYEKNLPPLLAHPYKIIQIFSNLILNAYQAMAGKGILRLKTRSQKGEILIEITDTGPGIPAEDLSKIFTPFFTKRGESISGEEGTGLGLYISKNIVDELNGTILVESAPGQGTTFRIALPVREKKSLPMNIPVDPGKDRS